MRARQPTEGFTDEGDLGVVVRLVENPAHQLEAQEDKIGVHHVGLAVIPDLGDPPFPVALPHGGAIHAQLAGEAHQLGQVVQRCVGPGLVQRQQIHQIQVPGVIAPDVVVPLEIAGVVIVAVDRDPSSAARPRRGAYPGNGAPAGRSRRRSRRRSGG